MNSSSSRFHKGITLVELQVALLLVAIIAVTLSGVMYTSSKTWQKVTTRQDTAEQQFLLSSFIRRHISNARFLDIVDAEEETSTSFLGSRNQMHFVAPFPSYHHDGSLFWWSLKLASVDEQDQLSLILEYWPYIDLQHIELSSDGEILLFTDESAEESGSIPNHIVLSDDVISMELEYYLRKENKKGEWNRNFEHSSYPPTLVRLSLQKSGINGEPVILPEMIISFRFNDQKIHARDEL